MVKDGKGLASKLLKDHKKLLQLIVSNEEKNHVALAQNMNNISCDLNYDTKNW